LQTIGFLVTLIPGGDSWTLIIILLLNPKLFPFCCDVAVTQNNYPSLNKQDSIEQARGWSHEEVLVQIFMLDVM
jgi:hypothetical protein